MKRRTLHQYTARLAEANLCQALLSLKNPSEMAAFLQDLCTPSEREVMSDRWRVVPYLLKGLSYRQIHERTAVSLTTIGRVARHLNQGSGGYMLAVARVKPGCVVIEKAPSWSGGTS